ncbi:MAG: hypothetical protein ISS69_12830 [Phycisphaerae bacterium]|nr:hypothetical protein [Phycisphaerae bacterium]
MSSTMKLIASALLISTLLCPMLAPAQTKAPTGAKTTAKTGTDDRQNRAKAAIAPTLQKYRYRYKLLDDQKAKLEKVLLAQYKDLMDHDKIHASKIKVVDEQIAAVYKKVAALKATIEEKLSAMTKEIEALEKQKSVYSKVRAELLLDHKAELNNVFTEQQRIASVVQYLKGSTVYRYWEGFSEAQKADLTEQFEAAALKVIQAKPEESDKVLSSVRREMQSTVSKLVTPEIRQAGETRFLIDNTVRAFYRIKLTDNQKDQIRQMCDKAIKHKGELYAQYQQLDKDRDAVRKSMSKYSTSDYYRKLRKEVSEKILTEEQRKAGSSRSSRPRSSSRKRPGGSSSSTRKTTRPTTKTPK